MCSALGPVIVKKYATRFGKVFFGVKKKDFVRESTRSGGEIVFFFAVSKVFRSENIRVSKKKWIFRRWA